MVKQVTHFVLRESNSIGEFAIVNNKIQRVGWGSTLSKEGNTAFGGSYWDEYYNPTQFICQNS